MDSCKRAGQFLIHFFQIKILKILRYSLTKKFQRFLLNLGVSISEGHRRRVGLDEALEVGGMHSRIQRLESKGSQVRRSQTSRWKSAVRFSYEVTLSNLIQFILYFILWLSKTIKNFTNNDFGTYPNLMLMLNNL